MGLIRMNFMDEMLGEINEWGGNPVVKTTDRNKTDLIEARAVINQMASALLDATRLRGLTAAINDPLALEGEKEAVRNRYLQIEANINAAIEVSRRFLK